MTQIANEYYTDNEFPYPEFSLDMSNKDIQNELYMHLIFKASNTGKAIVLIQMGLYDTLVIAWDKYVHK